MDDLDPVLVIVLKVALGLELATKDPVEEMPGFFSSGVLVALAAQRLLHDLHACFHRHIERHRGVLKELREVLQHNGPYEGTKAANQQMVRHIDAIEDFELTLVFESGSVV